MFCTDCGELIQRYTDKVRINNMLVHVHCALSLVQRLFPQTSAQEGQLMDSEGHYPYVVETKVESNVLH